MIQESSQKSPEIEVDSHSPSRSKTDHPDNASITPPCLDDSLTANLSVGDLAASALFVPERSLESGRKPRGYSSVKHRKMAKPAAASRLEDRCGTPTDSHQTVFGSAEARFSTSVPTLPADNVTTRKRACPGVPKILSASQFDLRIFA